jgi:hypothetical protein
MPELSLTPIIGGILPLNPGNGAPKGTNAGFESEAAGKDGNAGNPGKLSKPDGPGVEAGDAGTAAAKPADVSSEADTRIFIV